MISLLKCPQYLLYNLQVFEDPEQISRRIREQKKAQAAEENNNNNNRPMNEGDVNLNSDGEECANDTNAADSVDGVNTITTSNKEIEWPPPGLVEASFQWLEEAVRYSEGCPLRSLERLHGYLCRELERAREQTTAAKDGSNIVMYMKTSINYISKKLSSKSNVGNGQ